MNKKNRRIVLFILLFSPLVLCSQNYTKLSKGEEVKILEGVSSNLKSLQCNFRQEKKSTLLANSVISSGEMYFKTPASFRMEYHNPQSLILCMNNDVFQMKKGNGKVANATKGFQGMSRMIVGMLTGSEWKDEKVFLRQVYSSIGSYKVEFRPLQMKIKSVFTKIEVFLEKSTLNATKILFYEEGGDMTVLYFSDVKKNMVLSDDLFKL